MLKDFRLMIIDALKNFFLKSILYVCICGCGGYVHTCSIRREGGREGGREEGGREGGRDSAI